MFQLKNRTTISTFATSDIASICLEDKKKSPSIVAVPIHTIKLIHSIRKKLNQWREKKTILKKEKKKLAVFIPFRNRNEHLNIFIPQIRKFLKKSQIRHRIFVIEQKDDSFFNRAALLNLGVKEYGKNFDYYCFHDVDLIPIKADYNCFSQPFRLISFSHEDKKKIPKKQGQGIYNHHFASVISIKKEIFLEVNGFSNLYHHYGLEDDDFFMRLLFKGYIPCVDLSGYFLALPHHPSQKVLPSGKISKSFGEKRKLKIQIQKNKKLFSSVKREIKNPFLEGMNELKYSIKSEKEKKDYLLCSAHLLGNANSNFKK